MGYNQPFLTPLKDPKPIEAFFKKQVIAAISTLTQAKADPDPARMLESGNHVF